MLNEDFEKKLKAHLEEGRSDWDRDSLWDDIEAGLPKKRRRIAIWILFPFLIGIASAIYLGSHYFKPESQSSQKSVSPIAEELNSELNIEESIIKEDPTSGLVEENNGNGNNTQEKENPTAVETAPIENEFENETRNIVGAENGKSASDNQAPRFVVNELPVNTSTGNSIFDDELTSGSKDQIIKIDEIELSPSISSIYSQLLIPTRILNFDNLELSFPDQIKPATQRTSRSFIFLGGGASLASKSFQTIDLDASDYINARSMDEKVLESIRMQFGYGRFINPNISLSGNLDYEVINEQFTYTKSESSDFDTWLNDAYSFTNQSGETVFQSGKVKARETVNSRHTRYNSVRAINFSLLMGYHFQMNPVSFSVRTGPVFNLYRSFIGEVYSMDLEVENYNNQNHDISKLMSSWDVYLSVDKDISQRLGLSVGAIMRLGLSGFSLNGLANQKYNQWGVNTALVYKF